MFDSEIFLLEATRDVLLAQLHLEPSQCDVEFDEQVPAIVGDLYLAVIPAGISPGPVHATSGGVHDTLHSVQVSVFQRCTAIARDRRRSVFMQRLSGLNDMLDRVVRAVDWGLPIISVANKRILERDPEAEPFMEIIRSLRFDPKPRMVNSETYAAATGNLSGATPYIAMMRSVVFGGMRRIQTVQHVLS